MTNPIQDAAPVWTIGVHAWQAIQGVHAPWICEISPMQFAGMSKRAKAQYEEKRGREWQASADCKAAYAAALLVAYDAGAFTLDSPDLHPDAKQRIHWALMDREKAAQEAKKRAALDANDITSIDEIKVGDRLYSIMCGRYVEVVKLHSKSVRVKGENGDTWLEKVRALQRLSYNDCVARVA